VKPARNQPLVSIGMPIHNGAPYLREALDSLLSQDYPHFELTVSDNASTDDTPRICREYAARDGRIAYHRVELNMGAVWNFNRVLQLSRGEFFMWAAADDWRDRRCLSSSVARLQQEPAAVLCYCQSWGVGPARPWEDLQGSPHLDHPDARKRFRALLQTPFQSSIKVYSLIRRSALLRTTAFADYYGSDVGLLLQLCLQGPFLQSRNSTFYYRFRQTAAADPLVRYRDTYELLNPTNRSRPRWRYCWEHLLQYLRIAATAPAPLWVRALLVKDVLRYCFFTRSRVVEARHLLWTLPGLHRLRRLPPRKPGIPRGVRVPQ
jgi:glycosyltransferase involved in cell wall biosynthesis